MKIIKYLTAATALFLSTLTWFGAIPAQAAVKTCTWTGAGADNNTSTAANWAADCGGAPSSSDTLTLKSQPVRLGVLSIMIALQP